VIDFMELKGDIQVKFPKYDIFDLRKWVLLKYAKWYLRNQYSGNIQNINGNQIDSIVILWYQVGCNQRITLYSSNRCTNQKAVETSSWNVPATAPKNQLTYSSKG
jgi:hypothetical protein